MVTVRHELFIALPLVPDVYYAAESQKNSETPGGQVGKLNMGLLVLQQIIHDSYRDHQPVISLTFTLAAHGLRARHLILGDQARAPGLRATAKRIGGTKSIQNLAVF
jgi:hypothetical protein